MTSLAAPHIAADALSEAGGSNVSTSSSPSANFLEYPRNSSRLKALPFTDFYLSSLLQGQTTEDITSWVEHAAVMSLLKRWKVDHLDDLDVYQHMQLFADFNRGTLYHAKDVMAKCCMDRIAGEINPPGKVDPNFQRNARWACDVGRIMAAAKVPVDHHSKVKDKTMFESEAVYCLLLTALEDLEHNPEGYFQYKLGGPVIANHYVFWRKDDIVDALRSPFAPDDTPPPYKYCVASATEQAKTPLLDDIDSYETTVTSMQKPRCPSLEEEDDSPAPKDGPRVADTDATTTPTLPARKSATMVEISDDKDDVDVSLQADHLHAETADAATAPIPPPRKPCPFIEVSDDEEEDREPSRNENLADETTDAVAASSSPPPRAISAKKKTIRRAHRAGRNWERELARKTIEPGTADDLFVSEDEDVSPQPPQERVSLGSAEMHRSEGRPKRKRSLEDLCAALVASVPDEDRA